MPTNDEIRAAAERRKNMADLGPGGHGYSVSGQRGLDAEVLADAYLYLDAGYNHERENGERYAAELDKCAEMLAKVHPIGQVKAIGRLEVTAALREVIDAGDGERVKRLESELAALKSKHECETTMNVRCEAISDMQAIAAEERVKRLEEVLGEARIIVAAQANVYGYADAVKCLSIIDAALTDAPRDEKFAMKSKEIGYVKVTPESVDIERELQIIDERDEAEEQISQIYYLITGKSPEWSNNFGFKDAEDEIMDAVNSLKAAVKKQQSEPEPDANEATKVVKCPWCARELIFDVLDYARGRSDQQAEDAKKCRVISSEYGERIAGKVAEDCAAAIMAGKGA